MHLTKNVQFLPVKKIQLEICAMGGIDMAPVFNYNVTSYLKSIVEMVSVTVEGILSDYKSCKKYSLSNNVSEYMEYIEDEPFYISPAFSSVKTNRKLSTLNPKFILFSAPGATGKSSLAKYIAYKYNALYWNLAKIKLGTNSFAGSILSAVGASNYSSFISDLNSSDIVLAIDAFDEAEIISGRKMLSAFLDDINTSLTSSVKPTVLLFARTETAQFIASHCAENSISVSHYEIGFFPDTAAKEFILKKSLPKGMVPTPADIQCVESYYSFISRNITAEERSSFLGYAPVLEAIATHIYTSPNRAKLISELTNQNDCVTIIMNIMGDLLHREQENKVIPAFMEKCKEQYPEFDNWNSIYSEEEQLVRIINYIVFSDTSYNNYKIDILPPQMIDDYQNLLNVFLPQHPFVRNNFSDGFANSKIDFAGPAFRDYSLARIILSPYNAELANLYFEESQSRSYFPSQIFFDCYTKLSDNLIHSEHISYIYDSFRAKATAMEIPFLQCSELPSEDVDAININATFGMLNNGNHTKNHDDIILSVIVDKCELCFDQLVNVSIDLPSMIVKIGKSGTDTRIINSSVICREISFITRNISIESYAPVSSLFVSANNITGEIPQIDIVHVDNLRISAPNIQAYYKLITYKYNFENTSAFDITKFIHALRCILIEFRTDKKDTLAKTADRIENVTVGNSEAKRNVLDYLIANGIMYKSAHLYKIDEEKMQSKGISFVALIRMDEDQLSTAYNDFCDWIKK